MSLSGSIATAEVPQIILGQVVIVAEFHHWGHPAEGKDREDVGIVVRAFIFVAERIIGTLLLGDEILKDKFQQRKAQCDIDTDKVWKVLNVGLLRDERLQFDTISNDKEEPVEQDDSVRLSAAPMLIILYGKYHTQRPECQDGGPESEVGKESLGLSLSMQRGL